MNKKLAVWRLVRDSLLQNVPVVLLYVLESKGSSPGRQGFCMAVTRDGIMAGSIGGGMMEYKLVEMAKEKLITDNNNKQVSQIKKQIHDKSATRNQSGMICSGEQTVWLYPVQEKDAETIEQVIGCLQDRQNATLRLSPDGIAFTVDVPTRPFYFFMKDEADWDFKEKLGYQNHLYIIGGGHCALALSKLMSSMEFYIHLIDDRHDLLTMAQNKFAHEKKRISSYDQLSLMIPPGENNYVVVMTVGYRTDDLAVRALLQKKFRYFGLLGSKKKIQKMFDDYRTEGIDESLLQRIHAPIGIQIKSETPEEIAVSIAAEIIRVKNQ